MKQPLAFSLCGLAIAYVVASTVYFQWRASSYVCTPGSGIGERYSEHQHDSDEPVHEVPLTTMMEEISEGDFNCLSLYLSVFSMGVSRRVSMRVQWINFYIAISYFVDIYDLHVGVNPFNN